MNCVVGDVPSALVTPLSPFPSSEPLTTLATPFSPRLGRDILRAKCRLQVGRNHCDRQWNWFAAGEVVTVNIGGADTECDQPDLVTYDTLICATRTNYVIAAEPHQVDSVSATPSPSWAVRVHHSRVGFDAQDGCEDNGHVMVGQRRKSFRGLRPKSSPRQSPRRGWPVQCGCLRLQQG